MKDKPILSAKFKDTYTAEEMEQRKKQAQLDLAKVIDELTTHHDFTADRAVKYKAILSKALHDITVSYKPDDPLSNELVQTFDGLMSKIIVKLSEQDIEKKDLALMQGEFWPAFRPQKTAELKKEFALNFGGLERIEKDYKHLLKNKLSSGLTLQQHIDKVKNWFNSLYGENMGNWIKLFAYVKAVKEFTYQETEYINFIELGQGRYRFHIKQDKHFFSYFIKPDKKSGQFTTKAKNKFLKWLHENQNTIEFPMIIKGEIWNIPLRVYEYAENVSTKEIVFTINTNILESEFRDYISIEISEIDEISDLWENAVLEKPLFKKYRLNNFLDVPLKFLLTLKLIYNEKGNYTADNGWKGNKQTLSKENLNTHLGDLKERITRHLKATNTLRKTATERKKKSTVNDIVINLLLETTWNIAIKRKWLNSPPKQNENGTWVFNINPAYFAKRDIAERLQIADKT